MVTKPAYIFVMSSSRNVQSVSMRNWDAAQSLAEAVTKAVMWWVKPVGLDQIAKG